MCREWEPHDWGSALVTSDTGRPAHCLIPVELLWIVVEQYLRDSRTSPGCHDLLRSHRKSLA
jgi:hypothetical protein